MGEKYGVEVSKGLATLRSSAGLRLESESATGLLSLFNSVSGLKIVPVYLATNGATATAIYTEAVPLSASVSVYAFLTGKIVGATGPAITSFKANGVSNAAGSCVVHGTTTGGTDPESSGGTPAVTIVADDTADTIVVKVAGIAAEDWVWHGFVVVVKAQG